MAKEDEVDAHPIRGQLLAKLCLPLLLPALLGACGDGARMEVELFPADRFPEVTLEVEDRNGTRTLDRSDLDRPPGLGEPDELRIASLSTGPFPVAEGGPLTVRVQVTDQGEGVASSAVTFPAREAFRWSVDVAFLVEDPTEGCFGCLGARSFPVAASFRSAPAESLRVWWAGRREGSDVVF